MNWGSYISLYSPGDRDSGRSSRNLIGSLDKPIVRSGLAFSALFVAFWVGLFPVLLKEASAPFVLGLLSYSLVVLVVQLIVLVSVRRWVFFGVFSAANYLSFYLVYQESFIRQQSVIHLLVLIFLGSVLSFLFKAVEKNEAVFKIVMASSIALFALNLLPLLEPATAASPESLGGVKHHAQLLEPWGKVKFSQTPNVHLIGFDGLVPNVLAKKFLQVENLPCDSVLDRAGAQRIRNAFAAAVATHASFNAILKLDDGRFAGDPYFNGGIEGPVFRVFRQNGYKIATGFPISGVMGRKGDFVDEYSENPGSVIRESLLCVFQPRDTLWGLARGHFGICEVSEFFEETNYEMIRRGQWPDVVLETLKAKAQDSNPWLTLHHLLKPSHVGSNYVTGDKTKQSHYRHWYYMENYRAAKILQRLITQIKESDPNSVVLVFGDHGIYTSRTLKREDDPEFFVQDRHGLLVAFLPTDNTCSSPDLGIYNKEFHTLGRIMASIIRCLAENPELVDESVLFTQSEPLELYPYEEMQ